MRLDRTRGGARCYVLGVAVVGTAEGVAVVGTAEGVAVVGTARSRPLKSSTSSSWALVGLQLL
jgi:hypothetical protein